MNNTPTKNDISQRDEKSFLEVNHALSRILGPDDLVIDVGANRGQFSREVLALGVNSVIAFEPSPTTFQSLADLSRQDHRLEAINAACSTADTLVDFYEQEGDLGSSLLEPLPNQPSKWLTPNRVLKVKSTRLDTFFQSRKIESVGLLKSDAQGFDLEVLNSAGRYLDPQHIGALLVEVNFHSFYHKQAEFEEIYAAACSRGYFLAEIFRHYNRNGWLWWADALFLPRASPYAT